jgi:intracellular septation protein
MKFLFDLFPVIVFFITLKLAEHAPHAQQLLSFLLTSIRINTPVLASLVPILLATLSAVIASIFQILWVIAHRRKVDTTLWISASLVIVMGSLTIYFQNDTFIKWKPTALYWIFASILLFSRMVMKKNLIETMLTHEIALPRAIWDKLNAYWVIFLIGMGILNLYVAFHTSIDTWANFKLFGTLILTFLFSVFQAFYINRYLSVKP